MLSDLGQQIAMEQCLSLCSGRGVLKSEKKIAFIMQTETNVDGDALCFVVKTWARHKTTEKVLNNGWQ